MSDKFRIFQRASGVWYLEDRSTHHQQSLRARVATEAKRILQAKNEAYRMPAVNLQIARAYVVAADPKMAARTWSDVMAMSVEQKQGETQRRWLVATRDEAFRLLKDKPLIETTSEQLLKAMQMRRNTLRNTFAWRLLRRGATGVGGNGPGWPPVSKVCAYIPRNRARARAGSALRSSNVRKSIVPNWRSMAGAPQIFAPMPR